MSLARRLRSTSALLTCMGTASLAACSGPQSATYVRVHEGEVIATGIFGEGCLDDFENDRTFAFCVARVVGQDADGVVIAVASAHNVAFVAAVPCDADGCACAGDTARRTLQAGLFRVESDRTLEVLPYIQSLWENGGRSAIFRDAKCVPMSGSFRADTMSLLVLRAEFELSSADPVPPVHNRWTTCTPDPLFRRGPANIRGEIVQRRQRTDPGAALP